MTQATLAPATLRLPFPTSATGLLRRERPSLSSWVAVGGCSLAAVLTCAVLGPAHAMPGGTVMATVFLAALAANLAGGVAFSGTMRKCVVSRRR